MKSCIENTLCFQATMYDQMKPVTRKVLDALLWFETQVKNKKYIEVYASHKKIAKMAGCSISSLKTSIDELQGSFPNYILSVSRKVGFKTNIHRLSEKTYEFLYLLKMCRFTDRWKRVRFEVIQGLAEDELFLAEKLYRKGELSTTKLATSTLSKLATIKSLLLSKSIKRERTEEKRARDVNEPKKQRKEEGLIQDLDLSEKDRKWLSDNFAFVDLRKARLDADFYRHKCGKVINNMAAFLVSRSTVHLKERIKRF